MFTPHKHWFMPTGGQDFSLALVTEADGCLVIRQSNGPALRNFRNAVVTLGGSAVSFLVYYCLFPEAVQSWFRTMSASMSPAGLLIFFCLPFAVMVFQSVNRLFGKETFLFDKNQGVFIRNGFTVGPLHEIRAVTPQVSTSNGRNVMFRLLVELPYCETVPIVRTHDIPADGEFRLNGRGFGDPNTRFPAGTLCLNYEEQNVVPFLPQEITDLRRKILEYVGEARPVPHA